MTMLTMITEICTGISAVLGLAVMFVRPLRRWVLGLHHIEEGQKCLLRADMLRTYYRHRDEGRIRQYELENFLTTYKAYKALGGNSFIEHIYSDVSRWDIVS
ncbi:MAG: hypothetical protein IJE90_05460 [Clostridia bacterium]|nr:hypothetical protein [Clostridia bacterium]